MRSAKASSSLHKAPSSPFIPVLTPQFPIHPCPHTPVTLSSCSYTPVPHSSTSMTMMLGWEYGYFTVQRIRMFVFFEVFWDNYISSWPCIWSGDDRRPLSHKIALDLYSKTSEKPCWTIAHREYKPKAVISVLWRASHLHIRCAPEVTLRRLPPQFFPAWISARFLAGTGLQIWGWNKEFV